MPFSSSRILISRMSALGDTILTLPVACALRRHFPDAFLGWVVERRAASVLDGHDCIDEVIILDRGWFTSARGLAAARQQLRKLQFDVAIDCQGLTKSALAGWLSGAGLRIGARGQHGCELSPWLNNHLIQPSASHVVDRSLELLGPLGIARPAVEWRYVIDDSNRHFAHQATQSLGLRDSFAIINPGATWDSKRWEMKRFAAVARYLGQRHRLPSLVVWGNEEEQRLAKEIVAAGGGDAVLAPASDLGQLAALIEAGRLFISSDTGPMHLAVAVGTPTIGLHGATHPEDCGPHGARHRSIQVGMETGSRRQRRRADNSAMLSITAETVCQTCDSLLDRSRDAA